MYEKLTLGAAKPGFAALILTNGVSALWHVRLLCSYMHMDALAADHLVPQHDYFATRLPSMCPSPALLRTFRCPIVRGCSGYPPPTLRTRGARPGANVCNPRLHSHCACGAQGLEPTYALLFLTGAALTEASRCACPTCCSRCFLRLNTKGTLV